MADHIHNSCEDIDASMFGGDYFEDAEAREKLRFYVARWLRKMAELDGPGTSEMPDRIWAGDFNDQGFGHCVAGPQGGLYEEYIRADMVPASHDPVGAWL